MSDTNEREEYLAAVKKLHKESINGWDSWDIWQAATSASDARYQARIKELEEAVSRNIAEFNQDKVTAEDALKNLECAMITISTTTPDTALQRKVLEARLDEQCKHVKSQYFQHARVEELRAQLAVLDRNETLGE